MNKSHLLVSLSTNRMPSNSLEADNSCLFDPISQMAIYSLGGPSTSCHRVTNGTQPKNEADRIMDDN